jgi:hypothetical protein
MEPKQSESKPATSRRSVDESLVEVFGTKDDSEAMVVQGLLDSAGIDSVLVSLDAPQEVLPGVGGVVIRVAPEQAEEARSLIEEYRQSGEQAADEAEEDSEVNGGSAA